MRFLKMLLVFSVLSLMGLLQRFRAGNLDISGALAGIVCGVMLILVVLRRDFGLARKGIFVDKMSQYERKIMFFIIFPLAIVFGALMPSVERRYFSELDIMKAFVTGLLFFGFISGAIGALGIYFLERRYGRKFYIAKRKK